VRTLAHAARLIRKARRLGQYGVAVSEPVTQVPTAGAAFYPSTAAVLAKLGSQTPRWKWPLRRWMTRLRAWPSAPEALASAFDFNRAPFFQSFVEVRVGGSANVVRLLLYGANGQLHWHDLQVDGQVIPEGQDDRAFVEFRFPLAAADPKPSP